MKQQTIGACPTWPQRLDVVGSELFRRYRKRLREPGISWEIRRDYPGLALPDVWLRVHEARKIIRDGEDFAALTAIRGGWRPAAETQHPAPMRRRDSLSRALVAVGQLLFLLLLLVSLSSVTVHPAPTMPSLLLLAIAFAAVSARLTGSVWYRRRRRVRLHDKC